IQRRNQKLVEETPSPAMNASLRTSMGEAAVRLGRLAGYSNAGTVEFLLDDDGQFSFLEVNARLQVEHPVTEVVTGLDLVEQQLRVASGEPLRLSQADVRLDGHAIEVRVVAEDPLAGWAPSTGVVRTVAFPPDVRVDSWIEPGTRVSPYYDSLLAKVIAHAPTRMESIERLSRALGGTRLDGIRNNLDLLLAVLDDAAFRAGDIDTAFLEDRGMLDQLAEPPSQVLAAASALDVLGPKPVGNPWQRRDAWRIGRLDQPTAWLYSGQRHAASVTLDLRERGGVVRIGSAEHRVVLSHNGVSVDGDAVAVHDIDDDLRVVLWNDRRYRLVRAPAAELEGGATGSRSAAASGQLTASMPGRVVKINVEPGDQVEQNQPLVVIEAMKMEHVVEAPHSAVVSAVCVNAGEPVTAGTVLVELGSPESNLGDAADENDT
ncbi:MAG: hypothetical protein JOY61_22475, partial [Chloroflexi bacterium]|nr:hypothetical protein [Chloroflexota bacterium]